MGMIKISEKLSGLNYLRYVRDSLTDMFRETGCVETLLSDSNRCFLTVKSNGFYDSLVKNEIFAKIADVIAVGYKYAFLRGAVKPSGLLPIERDLFLTGIIAADYRDDKEYLLKKLNGFNDVAIDGFYNFRLKILKNKWKEIAELLPPVFTKDDLKEFLGYLRKESAVKVYLDTDGLYDESCRKLERSSLISGSETVDLLKEIVLSLPTEIIIKKRPPLDENVEEGIKEYFGGNVRF